MASVLKQIAVLAVLGAGTAFAVDRWVLSAPPEQAAETRARPAPGVEVAEVRLGEVERVISAVGSGRAVQSVELRVSDDGRVTEVLFRAGDPVRAGDPLLRLDDAQERAALAEAEAALEEARAAFQRADALRAQGRVTGTAFESARNDLARTEARHDRAATDLERRTLLAPFEGVIGFSDIDLGAVVTRTTVIARLDDLRAIEADFAIPERFFAEVALGDAVRAVTAARPDEVFAGEVAAIDRRVDEGTRSFRVRARFDNPDLRLPAGAFLRVELVLEAREGVLAPEEALVAEGGAAFAYVVGADDRVERRAVSLGARRAGEAEILDGLEPGERVVTRGVQKVRPGAPVRVMNAPEADPAAPTAPAAQGVPQAREGAAPADPADPEGSDDAPAVAPAAAPAADAPARSAT